MYTYFTWVYICCVCHTTTVLDIMPSVNDVLCILIIPLMDYIIYPHIETTMKIKLLRLHKVLIPYLTTLLRK